MNPVDPAGVLQQALLSYKQGAWDDAERHCRSALKIIPDHPGVLQMLGVVQMRRGRLEDAVQAFDRLLKTRPDMADVWNNRGYALQDLGRPAEAKASYDRALSIRPRYPEALNNRAQLLFLHRRFDEAASSYARLLEMDPRAPYVQGGLLAARMSLCDWTDFQVLHDAAERRLACNEPGDHPVSITWHSLSPALQRRAAEIYAARELNVPPVRRSVSVTGASPRIRLGYLSGDFQDHPMAYMFVRLFETHDRSRFETFAFSYGRDDGGGMRPRLRAAFDHFIDLHGRSDADAAETIRRHGIDLLVDLAAYTAGSRAAILAHRPAQLQVAFHGFEMGAPFVDYLISDRRTLPAELSPHFRERIVRLPDCWIATEALEAGLDTPPSRLSQGLPDTGFVFCCFNTLHKITPSVFDAWMEMLRAVEGSVLWLRSDDESAPSNLRREAEKRGIAAHRLIFARRTGLAEHLARHALADLFVDTFPYGAQTTGCHALWAGLPMLALRGEPAISRISASILGVAGLDDMVVDSLEAYRRLAIDLALDPARLAGIRQRVVEARRSPLFDAARYRRHVEHAYGEIHERRRRGEAPADFDVPALSTQTD